MVYVENTISPLEKINKGVLKNNAKKDSRLTRIDLAVINYFIDLYNRSVIQPKLKTIAEAIHASISSVQRAIRRLKQLGYITVCQQFKQSIIGSKRGRQISNQYLLNPCPAPACENGRKVFHGKEEVHGGEAFYGNYEDEFSDQDHNQSARSEDAETKAEIIEAVETIETVDTIEISPVDTNQSFPPMLWWFFYLAQRIKATAATFKSLIYCRLHNIEGSQIDHPITVYNTFKNKKAEKKIE